MTTPRPVVKRSYLNLDAIFGHVFSNVTGEPITPTKVATFYLIRVIFETHFGSKYKKSRHAFNVEQKGRIFHSLYGLMTIGEVSYKDYRMLVRRIFGISRQVSLNFYASMERIASGVADVNFNVEDEFYTNRHARGPNSTMAQYVEDYNNSNVVPFSSSQSFMYRWFKRILAQHAKSTPQESFNLTLAVRKWILADNDETISPSISCGLPEFIDCSMRARLWVNKTMFFIQKNPRYVFTYDKILHFARMVEERHRDVVEAHLLEAVVHVHLKDPNNAGKSMKNFFDLSMFELNENMLHASRTFRLTVPSQMSLLYAPILQARINRMFGDVSMARTLLRESIQQAQLKNDEICHQLANLELHIIDIVGGEALLEMKKDDTPKHVEKDRRIQRKALRALDDLHPSLGPMGLPCCSQTEDDFELCAEMDSMTKMLMMLRSISQCKYKLIHDDPTETGWRCPTGHDFEERGRKIEGYGYAIMTSNLIRNGMYGQAKAAAEEMLVNNCSIKPDPENYETETWAVGAVNLAYAHAGLGEYGKALATLEKAESMFTENFSWQCYRHIQIASTIVNFERLFLKGNYNAASLVISDLRQYSELEYTLRRALVLSAMQKGESAVKLLGALKVDDVRGRVRVHMQLASLFNAMHLHDRCELELAEASKLVVGTTVTDLLPMIQRRKATMLVCVEKYDEALLTLKSCHGGITSFGSFTEKAAYYVTAARAVRKSGKDPRMWLKLARQMVRGGQWPAMEKMILVEICALHATNGLMPDPDKYSKMCEQFANIATIHRVRCDWLFI